MTAAGLDLELARASCSTPLPPIPAPRQHMQGLVSRIDGFEALSPSPGRVWNAHGLLSKQGAAEEPQEVLWKLFFADTTLWRDSREGRHAPRYLNFGDQEAKSPLWLTVWYAPAWVDHNLVTADVGPKASVETNCTSFQGLSTSAPTSHLEIENCTRLCENGLISDAVDALEELLKAGVHVSNNVFYRVLMGCMQDKDLALGRRIHELIVKSGYKGDAFLATHLIGLYASHGRLEEAMGVFTGVPTPDAYNWSTIIFAYARHGEAALAAQAVQLYRQMRKSTKIIPDDRLYSAVLKACANAEDLVAGKEVHAHVVASARNLGTFVQTGLVNMYAKCGSLKDARRLFDELPDRNVVTWTAMIAGYAQHGMGQEALHLYNSMQQEGLTPNARTYACLLQACTSVGIGALQEGKQLHAEINRQGLQEDLILGSSLVNMYMKCGNIDDALRVFQKLSGRSLSAWNAMIGGYAERGMGQEALRLYSSMRQTGLTPNPVTYLCLLQACAIVGEKALDTGRMLHAQVKELGLQEDRILGAGLVNMYVKCHSLADARTLFHKLPEKNVVAWTTMIAGYAQQEMGQEALDLYKIMQQEGLTSPNTVTYVCLLQACASLGAEALDVGKQLHAQIQEQGLNVDGSLGASLVNMYAKCNSLNDARSLFDELPEKNVVTWTTMIAGYAKQGMGRRALELYRSMQQEGLAPNPVAFVCLLQACASLGVEALEEGKQLHVEINDQGLQGDLVVGGSLVNMYAKCGSLRDARGLFDKLPQKNIIAWSAVIAGYTQQGMGQDAINLYSSMRQVGLTPNSVTYILLLKACADVGAGAICEGRQLHAQIKEQGLEEDVVLGGSLVNMYAKCGSLVEARGLFNKLPERNTVAWNAMIAGYAHEGMGQDAVSLYNRMKQEGSTLDAVTYVCLLQACGAVTSLPLGQQLHREIEERGMQADNIVAGALVNMYAKCGSMVDSRRVFDSLSERSVEIWGALINGYAHHGDSEAVFDLLEKMKLEGLHPNEITFLSVLTVCCHVGLVDKGRKYFGAMRTVQGFSLTVEHYKCMVDLLGRAGHLDEALQMAKSIPFPQGDVVWHVLLSACLMCKNVDVAKQAFECAVSNNEKDAASFVLMSNIYASAGMWEEANELYVRRMKLGAWKNPGQSWWTDAYGVMHEFLSAG